MLVVLVKFRMCPGQTSIKEEMLDMNILIQDIDVQENVEASLREGELDGHSSPDTPGRASSSSLHVTVPCPPAS